MATYWPSYRVPSATSPVAIEPISERPIDELVEWELQHCPYAALRSIRCIVQGGHVILSGVVSLYYLKQVAQELVGKIPGVRSIDNRLDVQPRLRHGRT